MSLNDARGEMISGAPEDIASFQALIGRAKGEALYKGEADIQKLRAGIAAFADSPLARKKPDHVSMEAVDADGVRGVWLRSPRATQRFALLYVHGGGYVCGDVRSSIGVASSFCTALRCPVLAVEYRKAPEHRFPGAYDDVVRAARWLAENNAMPFLLAGDSAGGGLAVAAALQLAQAGLPPALGVISVSGVLDLTMSGYSWQANAGKDLISPSMAPFLYEQYLQGADARDVRASPVFADLKSLPPILIVAGGSECLLGDSELLAQAAVNHGCNVRFEIYDSMPHNFVKFNNPIADLAFERMGAWVRETLPQFYL